MSSRSGDAGLLAKGEPLYGVFLLTYLQTALQLHHAAMQLHVLCLRRRSPNILAPGLTRIYVVDLTNFLAEMFHRKQAIEKLHNFRPRLVGISALSC